MPNNIHKIIVLIEDEPNLISMYEAIFKPTKYDLFTATNYEDGFSLIKEKIPDLILLDVLIPRNDRSPIEFDRREGFELLKTIKNSSITGKIPVLTLTNLDSPDDRKKSDELGAQEYIVKANTLPKRVIEKVEQILK